LTNLSKHNNQYIHLHKIKNYKNYKYYTKILKKYKKSVINNKKIIKIFSIFFQKNVDKLNKKDYILYIAERQKGMIMNTNEIILIIESAKKDAFYNHNKIFGIRGDDTEFCVGDYFYNSHENGNGEEMSATCALSIDDIDNVDNIISNAMMYGNNVYLCVGDNWGKGDDKNEIKIKDAEILAIIK
jgi:hypothetical protein